MCDNAMNPLKHHAGWSLLMTTLLLGLTAAAAPAVTARTALPDFPDAATALSTVFFVAPNGSGAAPGTAQAPFATLEQARDALRRLRREGKLAEDGALVIVRGGRYRVRQPFLLTAEDSGEATAPIRYCRAKGETPVFSGGIRLEDFEPVRDAAILARLPEEARDKVVQVDLARYGVGELKPLRLGGFAGGLGFKTHPVMELFFNGEAMPLSRWPNKGFVKVVEVSVKDGHTIHGQKGSKIGRFIYDGDRPSRWKNEADVILYGYWFFGWADSYERVASIDPEKHEITLEAPYSRYGYRAGQPYRAMNLLCEIDMPGEWYLDRAAGVLYFYPPSNPDTAVVELSVADYPLVQLDNVSYTTLQGLTWELGGADGVVIRGGEHCIVAGCTVRRCGGNGIVVDGGSSHTLIGCDVYSMGRGGVTVAGGDRKTLAPGNHLVENCDIHDLSRIDHTYTPAILLSGVGNRIARNALHHIPSSAIRLGGNDHVVELNEIHHVVQESDDQGGIDMWGNATYRGNVFRYNYWHHIGNQVNPREAPPCGQAGIRLDDAISGVRIYGNVFYRASAGRLGFGGVQIHGGKDNLINNNVFIECMAAVSFSPWGDARWRKFVASAMEAKAIDPALYVKRYPALARLAEDHDVNRVTRNLVLNCDTFLRRDGGRTVNEGNVVKTIRAKALPVRKEGVNFQKLKRRMKKNGLDPIPFEEIGLYESPLRPTKD